mmetsp:Transcript_60133/g.173456  ORF Transcript_60133/g.173456 Transcript_60133/m.173456 type:complete len:347 (-) Transcript_60133:181-1221(-)
MHGFQPQHRQRRLRVRPQHPEVRPPSGVLRPCRVADHHHLMPGIRQQGEQALPLDVEAVGRPPDLRRPEETQLPWSILVGDEAPCVLHPCGLRPFRHLLRGEAAELLHADGVGVTPLGEVPLQHVRQDLVDNLFHLVKGHRHAEVCLVHRGPGLVERPQGHHQLALQRREHGLEPCDAGEVLAEADLSQERPDDALLRRGSGADEGRQRGDRGPAAPHGGCVRDGWRGGVVVLRARGGVLPAHAERRVVDTHRRLLREQAQATHDLQRQPLGQLLPDEGLGGRRLLGNAIRILGQRRIAVGGRDDLVIHRPLRRGAHHRPRERSAPQWFREGRRDDRDRAARQIAH